MDKLPPLNAMRTFEVAARAGSFTLAASELGVSSAAVSQQIRNLEDWFGKQLFMRNGNRIALTDAGHAIYPQTAHALGEIAAVGRRMLEGGLRTRLVVSVPFSLAELWLAPRLGVLLDGFPRMAIDVRVEDDPVDVVRQNIDLRISYGDYHYPALKMVRLVMTRCCRSPRPISGSVTAMAPPAWRTCMRATSSTPIGGRTMPRTRAGRTGSPPPAAAARRTLRMAAASACPAWRSARRGWGWG